MNLINVRSEKNIPGNSSENSIFSQPSASSLQFSHRKLNLIESHQLTFADALIQILLDIGVTHAFGISGGAIASLWASLEQSSIEVFHFRHEAGAVFAAIESYFVNQRPVVIFTTTGPGLTNALTGLFAARWEGAKVILLSAATPASQRGRWAFQETSAYTMPSDIISQSGSLFHYVTTVESDEELPVIAHRLALGCTQLGGFVAHLNIPTTIPSNLLKTKISKINLSPTLVTASETAIAQTVKLLSAEPFVIWVGFGAKNAATEIRQLAERTGALVICSPRGKGIFPEDHPQFLGVTGFGGHESVLRYMQNKCPKHILVLGTRLGEFTSFWSPAMIPSQSFIHVDIDPKVPGSAYPYVETFAIQSDIQVFVKSLLNYFPQSSTLSLNLSPTNSQSTNISFREEKPIRPSILMEVIQKVIVENSDAIVITEAGNSFAWGTNKLKFTKPGRYRVSTGFGSMGHAGTGVVGAALADNGKAVAILGDGAMLMNSEVSTAAKYQIPAIWIVLNDSHYNMCTQGMKLLGFEGVDTEIPQADFVSIARGMGADGIRVEKESELHHALKTALVSTMPFVIDVIIDPTEIAPFGSRIQSLIEQGQKNQME